MSRLALLAVCLLPLLADAASDVGQLYKVGVAQVDITPSQPIRLNGFGFRRTESEGVYHRIWARAMAIEDESKEPALLITVDVLGIPEDIRSELVKRFAGKVKPERLAITATHTHTGPMLKGANVTLFGVPIPKEHLANIDKYTVEFVDNLEKAGLDALAKREPSWLSYAIGSATFAKNRRTAGGPVDHDLPVLFVHTPEGKVRAIYTSYACHCVTLSHNKIGGDWAGFAAEAIESAFPGCIALMSVGCGADSNPTSNVTGDKVEVAQIQGREIGAEVKRLGSSFRTPLNGKLVAQWKQIKLPLANHPTRAEWKEKAKRQDAIGHHARVTLEKLDRYELLPTKIDYPIQTWSFMGEPGASATGALGIVFLTGEVVVDYSIRLKKELDCQRLWVNAYANGAPCYIPSERILKEGGYEGGGAMIYYDQPSAFKPGLEQPIVDVVKEQLGKAFPPKFDGSKVSVMPKSPQQSLAAIQTKPNLVVELVAAEPLVDSPAAIDFGPDGKLWVCEMIDYPEGKTGKFEAGGRISFLEDVDGDGRMDKRTTFLDGLPFPTGVKVWRKGVLICAAPDIIFAEDTNGDGKADVVKKLFSGFGTGNYQGRVNGLEYGLDGWVYGSCGLYGGDIKSFNGKTYALGNRDFRIKPDTGELEPVSGSSQQGRVRDDWGNWFGCDNSTLIRHYPLDDHYLKRNPHVVPPPSAVFVPGDPNPNKLFPINQSAQRFALSGPPGNVTAACGLCIYRDNLLGEDFRGNAFVCEPVNLLVHRLKLSPKGSTFVGHRPDDEKDREFLASTDNWFRPVQATTGPDGCLWIVDMYRHVIEHPRWIPPQDAAKLDLRAGAGMGRIYRVRPKTTEARKVEKLVQFDQPKLLTALNSANGWQRDMASKVMVWEPLKDDLEGLRRLVADSDLSHSRVTALSTLVQLSNSWYADFIRSRETRKLSNDPNLFRWCLQFAEHSPGTLLVQRSAAIKAAGGTNGQLTLQVVYSLATWSSDEGSAVLGKLLVTSTDDPYLRAAILSSVSNDSLPRVIAAVLKASGDNAPPPAVVSQLMRMAMSTSNAKALITMFEAATVPKDGQYGEWQFVAIAAYLDQPTLITPEFAKPILEAQVAARKVVVDLKASAPTRIAALALLARDSVINDDESEVFDILLSANNSPLIRTATVAYLGTSKVSGASEVILRNWKGLPPTTKSQVFDVLLSRIESAKKLLDAMETKQVIAAEIDASSRLRLLTHSNEKIRERATKIFDGTVNADRAKVIKEYAELPKGDVAKGKAVFTKVCAACHKLGDIGVQVGPDLATITNRTAAFLLQEILDPNRNLDSRYVEYQALTKANRTVSGLLAAETATSITLRGQQRKDETLLRTDIEELRGSGKSLMPEGLEKDLPKKDMADLLAFITAVRIPPKAIVGNAPTLVKVVDGRMTLHAAEAEFYGNEITFEPDFKNIGMWHGVNDNVEWRIELPRRVTFDIFFDYACDAGSAGNELIIEGIEPVGRWKVQSTGSWSKYQTVRVAIGHVAAGESRITIRPGGPLKGALIDLRTVYLVPPGQAPKDPKDTKEPKDPTDPTAIAQLILDDSQSAERRNRLIADNAKQSAALIREMTKDIKDSKEEYRRIPWIWRVAIAAGKRNDEKELRSILDASLPSAEPLRDWQAVVIGGGIINGISQNNQWPKTRLTEIMAEDRILNLAWNATLKQAFTMADNEKVPAGTRYDALRIVALGETDQAIKALSKYLGKGVNAELQQGAVSGLVDVHSPKVVNPLVKALAELTDGNRTLAIDGMMRTPGRAKGLLDALGTGTAKFAWLSDLQVKALLNHPDADVRKEAEKVLKR